MKTNKVSKFNVANFEVLETKGEVLKGGFSSVYTSYATLYDKRYD